MEWTLGAGLISILVVLLVAACVALWRQTGKQWHQTDRQTKGKRLVPTVNPNRARQTTPRKQNKQRRRQLEVDSKITLEVQRLYEQYGEEWINNAGKARLTLAIDDMLGPVWPKNSNVARAQRTLAAAVLEAVLTRKEETIHQRQSVRRMESQGGPQVEMYVDVPLTEHPATTEEALDENENYTNDIDDVDDIDDIDTDDIDDVNLDVD